MQLGNYQDLFKSVLSKVREAMKRLHTNGSYKAEDLTAFPEYMGVVNETSKLLSNSLAIEDNKIPKAMRRALESDIFLFSGLKTHAQLLEASMLLTDTTGIKPFSKFMKDIKAMVDNYNVTYLEAEYEFAVASAQSAANWSDYEENALLKYITAQDDRVRESHQVLNFTTLPKKDPFWHEYYPPNGWRCRCDVVEVLPGSHEVSDSEKAREAGKNATSQIGKDGKNRLEIFRFNPGKEKVIFPPKHPYHKIKGSRTVKKQLE